MANTQAVIDTQDPIKVLIVDDQSTTRKILQALLLHRNYVVELAVDGKEALQKIRNNSPDLVISDILMPQMDGFELCHEVRRDPMLQNVRLIFYTGTYLKPAHKKLALALGASAFISKPLEPDKLFQMIDNVMTATQKAIASELPAEELLLLREHRDIVVEKLAEKIKSLEEEVTKRVAVEATLEENRGSLRTSLIGTVVAFSRTVGMRDPYTAGHQQRVSQLSREIAQQLQLAPEQIDGLRMGAMIHDIGKIYLPAEILNKPGKIGDLEYGLVKSHAQVGYDLLKDVAFPWPIADIAYQHHERLDGSGYPRGLKGEAICLEARIVGVADVVEAMMSHRPYRSAWSREEALAEIQRGNGSEYDSEVVKACFKVFQERGFAFQDTVDKAPV